MNVFEIQLKNKNKKFEKKMWKSIIIFMFDFKLICILLLPERLVILCKYFLLVYRNWNFSLITGNDVKIMEFAF